ncbi:XRE family transcriptional regulator [Streptomyces sp. Ru71]|uniref:helix-turn-helix domain-containing protein n=1 Tax=Streptomyces sp. Ru71 TaxID=2080746 RepID=UPI0021566B07|nr:XRE family transcriptional regulator [Streptomyces sp. Ru71]
MPDELDPQIKEFTGQLRRLVDRSGLSIAALADRTGYSKTSWERYLGGRLLAPKGAIIALAEVTGTHPVHLTTMWELAERAWSRAEMRHDRTMEAIRISQARAALGDLGAPEAGEPGGRAARKGGSATATPVAGPAGVSPTVPPRPAADASPAVPPQPVARDIEDARGGDAEPRDGEGRNSWGLAGYRGPSPVGGARTGSGTPVTPPVTPPGPVTPAAPAGSRGGGQGGGKQRLTMFLAGLVGVLVVIAAVFFFTDRGGDGKNEGRGTSPSPTATAPVNLPPGVKCSGASCTGKDAEAMGCSGNLVTTAKTATVGATVVEVRYSRTCGAAWGRITRAAQGDTVQVSAGGARQEGSITAIGDTIAYTPMVAVKDAGEASACATLASGQKGCAK